MRCRTPHFPRMRDVPLESSRFGRITFTPAGARFR
jgi:hypothetical protein